MPGDLVVLPKHGLRVPVDMVVIAGTCIVNESNLTGESIPVGKMPLEKGPNTFYNPISDVFKMNTLFAGSQTLSATDCCAVVIRTSFQTFKGTMIRDILYPNKI